jgi:RNA polymerase sigma-70 factor, ECF subfamily
MGASSICIDGMNRASLLQGAKAGDRDSFAQLIGPYVPSLYRGALRLTASVADAEDVSQDSILKAMTRLEQFEGRSNENEENLHSWLSRIGRNTAIDVIRKRRAGKILSLDEPVGDEGETFLATIRSSEQNPEERFSRNESRKKLAGAISTLPGELRQVCLLRDVAQYSTQEVAEKLGISAMAVRLRLFRAHNRLRAAFAAGSLRKVKDAQANLPPVRKKQESFQSLPTAIASSFASGD